MITEEQRRIIMKLKEDTEDTAMNCRKALSMYENDVEKAKAHLKLYTWDSHGFKVDKEMRERHGR